KNRLCCQLESEVSSGSIRIWILIWRPWLYVLSTSSQVQSSVSQSRTAPRVPAYRASQMWKRFVCRLIDSSGSSRPVAAEQSCGFVDNEAELLRLRHGST